VNYLTASPGKWSRSFRKWGLTAAKLTGSRSDKRFFRRDQTGTWRILSIQTQTDKGQRSHSDV